MTNFKNNSVYILLGIILLVHSLILTKLIYFPYSELFIYPYLTNHGLKPYGQILDQHFPGLMFLPINLNNLGMDTPEMARIWSIAIVVLVQLMLFFVSSEILKSKTKAIFVNILYLIWQPFFEGWVLWIDSFLPLMLLPAFYFLYQGNQENQGGRGDKYFFFGGLFLGLGIVFKQTIIPLSFFTLIYIFWKTHKLKSCFRFLLGLFIPVTLMIVYLFSIEVFKDFWYWTVVFNLTTYAEAGRGESPTLAHLTRVTFVFGLPLLLLIFTKLKEIKAQLFLIFSIGTLIGLSTRFDFVHFQPALPFAVLATVWGWEKLGKLGKYGKLGVGILYGVVLIWWQIIFYKGHLGNRVISFDANTLAVAQKIQSLTHPREKIFVFGAAPQLYQMSGTLPAGNIFVFQFPWFLQIAESRILQGIIKDEPQLVILDKNTKVEKQKITEFGKNIYAYLNQNYQKIDSIGAVDILRRITP